MYIKEQDPRFFNGAWCHRRELSTRLTVDLVKTSLGNSTNHLQFGSLMSKYLERMSKSNDQILKLAEIIAKEQEKEATVSPDDIFKSIGD